MKNKIITIAALTAIATASSASSLVAGWDFSQSQFANTTAAQNGMQGSWSANYSYQGDTTASANYNASAAFGTVYWDGSFGSSTTNFTAQDGSATVAAKTSPVSGLSSNDSQSFSTFNASSSYTALTASGQTVAVNAVLGLTDDVAITFALDAGTAKNSWTLAFAALDTDGASLGVAASTTGAFSGEQTSFGTLSIGTTDTGYTTDFSSLGDTQTLYVRLSASSVSGGTLSLDNVGFSAAVVPEPSTYAAIFGVIAIAFAVVRRRRA
jgi:hypothetical protein